MAGDWKFLCGGPCSANCPQMLFKGGRCQKKKKQSLPTFPQSSDFSPSLDFMGQIALSFFAPGFILAGTVFIFKAKHSPTCISLRESLLDLNSRSYWCSQEVIVQFTLKRGVTGIERCTGGSGIQLMWPSGQGERAAWCQPWLPLNAHLGPLAG